MRWDEIQERKQFRRNLRKFFWTCVILGVPGLLFLMWLQVQWS